MIIEHLLAATQALAHEIPEEIEVPLTHTLKDIIVERGMLIFGILFLVAAVFAAIWLLRNKKS